MGWFEMHPALLDAYAEMRDRLEAEEALHTLEVTVAGSEYLKPADRDRIVDRWHAIASGGSLRSRDGLRDEHGRTILHTGQGVRDWLVRMGGFGRHEVTG